MTEKKKSLKSMTQNQAVDIIAEKTGVKKSQIKDVIAAYLNLIQTELSIEGRGVFLIPNLVKMIGVRVPARPEETLPNPFRNGEFYTRKAKPAHIQVKFKVLRGLRNL